MASAIKRSKPQPDLSEQNKVKIMAPRGKILQLVMKSSRSKILVPGPSGTKLLKVLQPKAQGSDKHHKIRQLMMAALGLDRLKTSWE